MVDRRGKYSEDGQALLVECGTKTVTEAVEPVVKNKDWYRKNGYSEEWIAKVWREYVDKPGYDKSKFVIKDVATLTRTESVFCEIPILKHNLILTPDSSSKMSIIKGGREPTSEPVSYQFYGSDPLPSASVPEPSVLALVLVSAVAALMIRRRNES